MALATLLKGQHFILIESVFHDLIEHEYIGEHVEDKTCVCIGHDLQGDAVCISIDLFKPEMLELDSEEINSMAFTHPLAFWINEEEIEVKL